MEELAAIEKDFLAKMANIERELTSLGSQCLEVQRQLSEVLTAIGMTELEANRNELEDGGVSMDNSIGESGDKKWKKYVVDSTSFLISEKFK